MPSSDRVPPCQDVETGLTGREIGGSAARVRRGYLVHDNCLPVAGALGEAVR
jgi:lipoate-protein ligase A